MSVNAESVRGLFNAIEFVSDMVSKAPFDRALDVAKRMGNKGLEPGYDVTVFAATGAAADGREIISCLRRPLWWGSRT